MKFRVLGPLELELDDGQLLRPRGQLGRLLLSLLGAADRPVTIDRLVEDVWATESPPATARTAIHVHISKLRRMLDEPGDEPVRIDTEGAGYVLRLGSAELDATTFRTWLAEGRAVLAEGHAAQARERLTAALELWRGPALAGHESEPSVAAWAVELDSLRHQAEEDLVAAAVAEGGADAVTEARRLVTAEPLRERRWELLMLALYRAGRQAEALRAYQEARTVLLDQVGIEPGRELQLKEHAILVQDPSLDGQQTPSMRPPPPRIPGALAPLVDRDEERRLLHAQIDASRVVTIWGPPGVGKTRLAFHMAAEVSDRFADGVWVVELASVEDPTLVATRVADALGLKVADAVDGLAIEALLEQHLAGRHVLLVLDNCEQVLPACRDLVQRLCGAVVSLHVLATSREPLSLSGEVLHRLAPLAVPPSGVDVVNLRDYPAVRLFEACVLSTSPGFDPVVDAEAVARICRRVDGLPLALELVAAWGRVLSVGQIADELDDRLLPLVAAPSPAGDGRYVTMTATIDAAYRRLRPGEQRLLRWLAPFVGGFDVDAVNAVAANDGVIELARLVETSMVEATPERGRYRMLEPIRQFALTTFEDAAEATDAHGHQASHMCAVARRVDATQRGPGQKSALDRLDRELDNLRAALGWAVDHDRQLGLQLVIALRWFWEVRGHWLEGLRWFDAALDPVIDGKPTALLAEAMIKRVEAGVTFAAMADNLPLAERGLAMARATAPPRVVANACMVVAIGLGWLGADLERAEDLMDEALDIAVADGDRGAEAWVVRFQGLLRLRGGDPAGAYDLQQRSLAIAEQAGDACSVGHGQVFLGRTAFLLGDLDRAHANLVAGTRRCRELGSLTFVHGLLGLAQVEHAQGDLDGAEIRFREAVAVTERIGDLGCSAVAWRGLGSIAISRGDHDTALARLRRALVIFGRLNHTSDAAGALIDVAAVAAADGDPWLAARLIGAATALDHGSGTPLAPADLEAATALLADVDESIGAIERNRAVEAGGRLSLDQALAQALDPSLLRMPTPAHGSAA